MIVFLSSCSASIRFPRFTFKSFIFQRREGRVSVLGRCGQAARLPQMAFWGCCFWGEAKGRLRGDGNPHRDAGLQEGWDSVQLTCLGDSGWHAHTQTLRHSACVSWQAPGPLHMLSACLEIPFTHLPPSRFSELSSAASCTPLLGMEPATQTCALTGS